MATNIVDRDTAESKPESKYEFPGNPTTCDGAAAVVHVETHICQGSGALLGARVVFRFVVGVVPNPLFFPFYMCSGTRVQRVRAAPGEPLFSVSQEVGLPARCIR